MHRVAAGQTARRAVCWLLLALFTLFGLALQWYYIRHDGRPLTYDDAWNLENSLHLYHRLSGDGLVPFLRSYTEVFGIKAPLIAVLPLPFYAMLGPRLHSALAINSLFLIVINVCLFALAARWYSPWVGLLSVVVFQTMPLAIGMSRAFMTEYGLAALTIVFVYYLEQSQRLRAGFANFMVGVIGGLGVLMKITFPAVVLAPALVTWMGRRDKRDAVDPASGVFSWYARRPVAAIALTAGFIASTWYAFNLAGIVQFSIQTSYGEIAKHYQAASRWVWWRDFGWIGISSYYTLVLLGLLLAELIVLGARRGHRWTPQSALLLSWLLPPAVAVWLSHQQDLRHALVILPPLAIWVASRAGRAIAALGRPAVFAAFLSAAFLSIPVAGYLALTFPVRALGSGFRIGPFRFLERNLGWARRPDRYGDWNQAKVVEAMKSMAPSARAPCYVIVGVEHPFFNANILGYLNAYEDGPFRFTSLGFDPDTPFQAALRRALDRIRALDPSFIVMAEGFRQEELQPFLNRLNDEIRARLDSGDLSFRRRAEIQLTEGIKAIIYESERLAPRAWKADARSE